MVSPEQSLCSISRDDLVRVGRAARFAEKFSRERVNGTPYSGGERAQDAETTNWPVEVVSSPPGPSGDLLELYVGVLFLPDPTTSPPYSEQSCWVRPMSGRTLSVGDAGIGRLTGWRDAGGSYDGMPIYTLAPAGTESGATAWKEPVRAATTANGTLATAFANGQTVDGVTLATGDRLLIKDQSSGAENGIYVVAASGAPTRATDADTGAELLGACVAVCEGTTQADTVWLSTANATITIGSTAIPWRRIDHRDTVLTVAGADGTPSYSPVNTIEIDQSTGLTLDEPTAGTARVGIDLAVAETETVDRVQFAGVLASDPPAVTFAISKRKVYYDRTAAGVLVAVYEDETATESSTAVAFEDTDTLLWNTVDAATVSAVVNRQMSIVSHALGLKLEGDEEDPAASSYYGTDAAGAKGWQPLGYTPTVSPDSYTVEYNFGGPTGGYTVYESGGVIVIAYSGAYATGLMFGGGSSKWILAGTVTHADLTDTDGSQVISPIYTLPAGKALLGSVIRTKTAGVASGAASLTLELTLNGSTVTTPQTNGLSADNVDGQAYPSSTFRAVRSWTATTAVGIQFGSNVNLDTYSAGEWELYLLLGDLAEEDTVGLPDAAVTTAKIATGAVTTAKIADGGITAAKLGLTLDEVPPPAADLDAGGFKITNLAAPASTSDAATKGYVDSAVTGLLDFKGSTDASANPNYPAALKGDAYVVSVAGKIGGASGVSVDVGDVYLATADNAGGTQAGVGTSWAVLEHNVVGALLSANNLSDVASAATAFANIKQPATTSATGVVELATDGETASGVVVQGNDSRLADARTPTGSAGGDLSGTYPNPTLAAVVSASTKTKITYNAKGQVTAGADLAASDLPALNGFTDAEPALDDVLPGYDTSATANRDFVTGYLLGLSRVSPGGRLTLTSGTPVTSTDVTAATSVYYTPFASDLIVLWDGTRWVAYQFAETTLALGTVTSGLPYDVFGYLSGGTLTLEKVAWTNGTTRATAITIQDGRYCKSGDKTKLYLGTFYTTSTSATEDSLTKRFVWNMYNRVQRGLLKKDVTATWNYTTATWRSLNNSTANRVEVVCGLAGLSAIRVDACTVTNNSSANIARQLGIGLDSTTVPHANAFVTNGGAAAAGALLPLTTQVHEPVTLGYHYYQVLERSAATGTCTWNGTTAGIGDYSGITGGVEA